MKKTIFSVITGLFLLGSMVGCGSAETEKVEMEVYSYLGDEKIITIENEHLKLEMDPITTYFKVIDKSTKKEWNSNPEGVDADPLASGDSKNFIQSTLLVDYVNKNDVGATLNNFKYSIQDSLYNIETGEDFIKVHYTVGSPQKIFTIPMCVTKERLDELLGKLESKDARKIKENYKKYDINKLGKNDNKEELLTKYPRLENEVLYVLRETVQDYLKADMEVKFEAIGYTVEDFEADAAVIESDENKPFFNITVNYKLEGEDFVVEAPIEEMQWKEEYPLTSVTLLPMFGAGGIKDEGYMLVPNGMGSIINFNNGKNEQTPFMTDIYGWDYGIKRSTLIQENIAAFGAYAISNNDKSILCLLEKGAPFASVKADVSGRGHSYNTVYSTYKIIHKDAVEPSVKSSEEIIMFEKKAPSTVITQRYKFVEGNDYNDLTVAYRDYLSANYKLTKNSQEGAPTYIELIGAIDKIKQKYGVPKSVIEPLTTFDEAKAMVEELKQAGMKNLDVIYTGWLDGGVNHDYIGKIGPLRNLGGKSDLKKFIKEAGELGTEVYLSGTVQSTEGGSIFEGFSINKSVARHLTREKNEQYPFSYVWYGELLTKKKSYLVTPSTAMASINKLSDSASKYKATGINLQDIGNQLVTDYNHKKSVNRENAIDLQTETISGLIEDGQKVITNGGHDYTLAYSEAILNMDMTGNDFAIIDEHVPFYTMAIHGLVDYSGCAINLAADYEAEILKSVENGAGLSFSFMGEDTMAIQESEYTYLYGADYELWKDKAIEIYNRYEKELGHTFKQAMKSHKKLADGIYEVEYEDGTKAYINYTKEDYKEAGVSIPAKDYTVERR